MSRRLLIAVVAALVALPSAALAASPTKGGRYEGQDSREVKLVFKVSPNGKTGKADLFCSNTHISSIKKVAISKGRFYAIKKSGNTKLYSIKGRFTSATEASVTVSLKAVCAGGSHNLKLALAS